MICYASSYNLDHIWYGYLNYMYCLRIVNLSLDTLSFFFFFCPVSHFFQGMLHKSLSYLYIHTPYQLWSLSIQGRGLDWMICHIAPTMSRTQSPRSSSWKPKAGAAQKSERRFAWCRLKQGRSCSTWHRSHTVSLGSYCILVDGPRPRMLSITCPTPRFLLVDHIHHPLKPFPPFVIIPPNPIIVWPHWTLKFCLIF